MEHSLNTPMADTEPQTAAARAAGSAIVAAATEPLSGAAAIARGAARLFDDLDCRVLPELPLANGRRADLVALNPSGRIAIVEVKASLADFRNDHKWRDYRPYCDTFWFAVAPSFPQAVLPTDTGLIVADGYGGAIVRNAPEHVLAAARRKAMTLRFARAAAARLRRILDPGAPA